MRGSILQRAAFALGVFTRSTVQVLAFPVRAAGRLLSRWWPRDRSVLEVSEAKRLLPYRSSRRGAISTSPSSLSRAQLDSDVDRRVAAALAAGELDGADAGPIVLELLNDSDAEVRCAAAEAAGRARAAGAVFSLILALDDPAPSVRAAAEKALRRLTGWEIDLATEGSRRREQMEDLKRRWKEQRLAALAGAFSSKRE